MRPSTRRLLLVCSLSLLPWSVQPYAEGGVSLLFAWGLVSLGPLHVTTLIDFLVRFTMGLPPFILAWPASVVCYLIALASAGAGLVDREDPRVTAGLLVLAGVAQLSVATGFSVQPGRVAYPIGTAFLWAVVWGCYRPLVRSRR